MGGACAINRRFQPTTKKSSLPTRMSSPSALATSASLSNASQWYRLIHIIKSRAKQSNIWRHIDLALPQKPTHDTPTLPLKANIRGNNPATKKDNYNDAVLQYNYAYKEYKERRTALFQTPIVIRTNCLIPLRLIYPRTGLTILESEDSKRCNRAKLQRQKDDDLRSV